MTTLSVVVPVYNEEAVLPETLRRMKELRNMFPADVSLEYLYIDDGSTDKSLFLLQQAADADASIKVLSFSRNFGHQMAITAGIDVATGAYVAVIDADLQDPPELLVDMYSLMLQGQHDVVYGKRAFREGETWFKKASAALFYRILSKMCDIEIPQDTGDFRLMSRKVVDCFKQLRERHRFVRGMIPWLGFSQAPLEYTRHKRFAGKTKYPLRNMLAFATNAILSFSNKPLTIATRLGFASIIAAFMGAFGMLLIKAFTSMPVPGLASIIITIAFFSGIQLFVIGLVGEYVARIFEESKGRPLYIVDKKINV